MINYFLFILFYFLSLSSMQGLKRASNSVNNIFKPLNNKSYFNFSRDNFESFFDKNNSGKINQFFLEEKQIESINNYKLNTNIIDEIDARYPGKFMLSNIIELIANYKFFINFFNLNEENLTEESIENAYKKFIDEANSIDNSDSKNNIKNTANFIYAYKDFFLNNFNHKLLKDKEILAKLESLGINIDFKQESFLDYLKNYDNNFIYNDTKYNNNKSKIEYLFKIFREDSEGREKAFIDNKKHEIEKIRQKVYDNILLVENEKKIAEKKEQFYRYVKGEKFKKIGFDFSVWLIISGIIYNMLKDKDTSVSKEDLSLIIDAFDSSSFKDFKDSIRDIKIFKNLSDDYLQNIYDKTEKERKYGIFKKDSIEEIIAEIPDLKILKNDKNGEAFLTIFASKVSDIREEKAYKERIKNTDPKIFNVEEKDLVKEEIKKEKELAFEKQNKEALEAARLNNLSDEYIKNTNSNIFTVEEKDSLSASAEPIKSRNNFLTASIFTGGLIAGAGILNNYRKSKDKNFFDYIKNKYNKFKKYLFTK